MKRNMINRMVLKNELYMIIRKRDFIVLGRNISYSQAIKVVEVLLLMVAHWMSGTNEDGEGGFD